MNIVQRLKMNAYHATKKNNNQAFNARTDSDVLFIFVAVQIYVYRPPDEGYIYPSSAQWFY